MKDIISNPVGPTSAGYKRHFIAPSFYVSEAIENSNWDRDSESIDHTMFADWRTASPFLFNETKNEPRTAAVISYVPNSWQNSSVQNNGSQGGDPLRQPETGPHNADLDRTRGQFKRRHRG